MKRIKINSTDIFLENFEEGKGKIIVSDIYNGSYTFYWGSMASSIENFMQRINSDYFAGKLSTNSTVFSGKNTAYQVRQYIREQMSYDLPWFKFMSAQKELRQKIKEIEKCDNQYAALSMIESFHKNLDLFELSYEEEREFRKIIEEVFTQEPWHFLETEPSDEYKFLKKLHKDIVKHLKKIKN